MPNHLHMVLPQTLKGNKTFTRRLGGYLAGISQNVGIPKLWQPLPPPSLVSDREMLERIFRYIALNPCRKSLCKDPLEWYWSTYREIIGASYPSRATETALILGRPTKNFGVRFHSYVSADPSVSVTGTPPPFSAPPTLLASSAILEILGAAAGALRVSPLEVKTRGPLRTLFIHLAARHGWRQVPVLAQITHLSERSVYRCLDGNPPKEILAADLCLGDPRLRPKITAAMLELHSKEGTTHARPYSGKHPRGGGAHHNFEGNTQGR